MANRDYANKPKPRKGATRQAPPRRAAPKTEPKRPSKLLAIASGFALVGLIGLVAFLVSDLSPETVNKSPTPSGTVEPAQEKSVVMPDLDSQKSGEPRAPGESLPLDGVDLEEAERFGFYKLLQETEVKTPEESAYTSTPKTAALESSYVLQAGSFRNQSDAEAMRARLTLSNLPNVKSQRTEGANGIWYRVITGPFTTFSELKSAKSRLEKLNIHPIQRKVD